MTFMMPWLVQRCGGIWPGFGEGAQSPKKKTLIFVNNRLEGNAPNTIAAMVEPED